MSRLRIDTQAAHPASSPPAATQKAQPHNSLMRHQLPATGISLIAGSSIAEGSAKRKGNPCNETSRF
jgi:hypothetical protein